jgi:hypothetical protein
MSLPIYSIPFYYKLIALVWKNTSSGDFFSTFQDIILKSKVKLTTAHSQ